MLQGGGRSGGVLKRSGRMLEGARRMWEEG